MNPYYLMAQLPSLDGIPDGAPLPITQERYEELCRRNLGKRAQAVLDRLTLIPPREKEKTGSPLLDAWNENERNLRRLLADVRSARRGLGAQVENASTTPQLSVIREAMALENPLEAELLLNGYRLRFLETLRPADAFSEETVFYYGLKLQLMLHIRRFDAEAGRAAYRAIYHSILEKSEVVQ